MRYRTITCPRDMSEGVGSRSRNQYIIIWALENDAMELGEQGWSSGLRSGRLQLWLRKGVTVKSAEPYSCDVG